MPTISHISIIIKSIFLSVLIVIAHGLFKWVAQHPAESYLSLWLTYWPVLLVSIVLYFFVFFYYAHLLKTTQITLLYPIYTGLSIVILLLVGKAVFNETVSLIQVAGCFLIITGIFCVSK